MGACSRPAGAPGEDGADASYRLGFEWEGRVLLLSHGATQHLLHRTESALEVNTFVLGGLSALGVTVTPAVAMVAAMAGIYINAQRRFIDSLDQGKGVRLIIPYRAITSAQWWLIIPAPR